MTEQVNEWAVLDDLYGLETTDLDPVGEQELAFYGRCSTEDNQDPETSCQWQLGNAEKFVSGRIVKSYFDIGQSRSVPWHRRTEAAKLLDDLRDPGRGWAGIVVGEGTRCWFGNQFSLVAPRIHAYGVSIWVPELGGRYDPDNVTHTMMMNMLGGLSESERQHVQQRTRASMNAQVLNEGRHQGGRAPYGYLVVDGPPHPNPNRAADNLKLRILSLDAATAPVVQRIFRLYLEGRSDRAIATELNRENIPCPSAHRPEQNRHRSGDGWQATTVGAILQNPRYTGYAVFGRWTKTELLLDPDDVAAGNIVKFKRSPAQRIVRSRRPAHAAIVSVETFTQATLERKKRAGAGNRARSRLERTRPINSGNTYLFRGRVYCEICNRKMQGEMLRKAVYYRCRARTLPPGSSVREIHPPTVNLREADIIEPVDEWLSTLFHPEHLDRTIAVLLAEQDDIDSDTRRASLRRRIELASTRIERHLAAIEAGVDAQMIVDAMNAAQADKASAQVELNNLPTQELFSETELRKLIESHGDIRLILAGGAPENKKELYNAIELQVRYAHLEHRMIITTSPVGDSAGVRRGT
ncbi:recombinase family protein [Nocardia rhizosphaerihabitans]|uniref:Recombinase n=1 Tax=Nocardia rhizosphaerihabitans TaxID=1691570 RepID=A0ABQ2K6N8_9NOCA|nr:recombinase family protein [Nocardia rhizosphaerihabitans]GGN66368.1 recombinase [Nocardia rhizosphaerihabitans]